RTTTFPVDHPLQPRPAATTSRPRWAPRVCTHRSTAPDGPASSGYRALATQPCGTPRTRRAVTRSCQPRHCSCETERSGEGKLTGMVGERLSIQEGLYPSLMCYGCGPANPDGLHLRSFREDDLTVAEFVPRAAHDNGFGFVNGGIIATVLDC